MRNKQSLSELEKLVGITFQNKQLLLQAITHCSYLNEHWEVKDLGSNELLEFLGDAVLELVVKEYLFRNRKSFIKVGAGYFTDFVSELVNNETLGNVCHSLGLASFLRVSYGMKSDLIKNSNSKIFADLLEAFIGALYLDRGKMAVEAFILNEIIPRLEKIMVKGSTDWKGQLQELTQANGVAPHYETLSISGPAHSPIFEVGVFVGDRMLAKATATNKKKAEQGAARLALKNYKG